MSNNEPDKPAQDVEPDVVESIIHHMPIALPWAGGIFMKMLACLAVFIG